ncbi:DUF2291 domain-containing protein [Sphaerochaeta halotolerans]|uniref:DUF2291 domain-containing protein n=1 Tax=Sphaerochaeta halotolerans TaxID=2293840 RepID=A0A372MDZ2_9SPIR|nr:DUF2291 domain-containing protein [Sphaerochaeta halotolerans]RFU93974.1 DUF2291 domain-containing protein [Sphaerochaeta halotolerans]
MKLLRNTCLILIISALFMSCTFVKHDGSSKNKNNDGVSFYFEDESFDAVEYVHDIWDDRVLTIFEEEAYDLKELLSLLRTDTETTKKKYGIRKEELSPYTFIVSGTFPIYEVNRDSSAGLLVLDLPDLSQESNCTIQIGPVIKKSMVRDALEFIKFDDFNNQIEFANISREINFYIRDNVVSVVNESWEPGMNVSFLGAFTLYDGSEEIMITPVWLELNNGESDE